MSPDNTQTINNEPVVNTESSNNNTPKLEQMVSKVTTLGYLSGEILYKAIAIGLAKEIDLTKKNIFQLSKLARRHPAMALCINDEMIRRKAVKQS
jgi:hypothetical protein